ncbi:ABC transporter permease [Streptomyces sp. NPDC048644]|uniref:ABC transporter permease n=1 Tax=Streptomyces sp. NPDC048644 TaxID=3365582 RepID=UPI00371F923A
MTTALTAPAQAEPRVRRIRPGLIAAGVFLALVVLAALAPGLLTTYAPDAIRPADFFQPPSAAHWFGTDQNGRDVYTRLVHGAGQSLLIGLGATAISLTLGITLGLTAALGGRRADFAVGRVLEVLFAFPGLLLALLFIAVFGTGAVTAAVAVGIGEAAGYARLIRAQATTVVRSGYVEAARGLGHPPLRVVRRTVLPNVLRPLAALATLGIGQSVVWASSLSFLGLGAQPPAAEWGAMLADGRTFLQYAWWTSFFPGLFIVLTTLSTTVLGRRLQAWLDARSS